MIDVRRGSTNEIGVATRPVKNCFQNQYSLPTFQRDYKWEGKHFTELLNDIQQAFRDQYEPTQGRKEVATYRTYFVGSIITSGEVDGKRPLIDGQQRLTSLFVLMAFLKRYCHENKISDVQDLLTLLQRSSYGTVDFSIDFSPGRRKIFEEYLDLNRKATDALQRIDALADLDEGDRKIIGALRIVENELDDDVKAAVPFFIDYLVEKVVMIEIAVPNENDAHRVFVTMNDRGLRLGPIDLLKGHILSRIQNPDDNKSCHELWIKTVKLLKEDDSEEDSLFFRSLLRARWAETLRETKKKGDPPGDFENIGDAYHRWFAEYAAKLGYVTSDDYVRFAREEIPKYAEIYRFIREAEERLDSNCEHVFYNAARKYTLQPMVLLASILPGDSITTWRQKIKLTSQLIDLILTARSIDGKENNYDSLKDLSFVLAKRLRGKDLTSLLGIIRSDWPTHFASISRIATMVYAKSERTDLLYVLARIGSFLEQQLTLTNSVGFETYWSRDRGGKTFDVEHILSAKALHAKALGFASDAEYSSERNKIGALVVLPRSRNRSLQDKPYSDKLTAYATENILAQSLSPGFYASNPNAAALAATYPELAPIVSFDKSALAQRASLYAKLAQVIWAAP